MSLSLTTTFLKKVTDVLTIEMKDQITRLTDRWIDSPIKRKRVFDDITNVIPTESSDNDDTMVLKEIDLLLGFTHTLKRWYLGILQKNNMKNREEDFQTCQVIKKGVVEAERHALRILDHVETYAFKRLDLFKGNKDDWLDQKKTTLATINMIYMIKTKHMMKEIISICMEKNNFMHDFHFQIPTQLTPPFFLY
ncbi:hypothetical protein BC941DRAFT_417346 [Chlamydoabsidia padenii]|nr:hypothetical protein BC941DRAFT_417346 [Chlamydoabsidia padenii]